MLVSARAFEFSIACEYRSSGVDTFVCLRICETLATSTPSASIQLAVVWRRSCSRAFIGDLAGARDSAREGLRVARQARAELHIAIALQHLALLAGLVGNGPRAAPLLGYADARYTELGTKREPTEQWGYDKLLVALREMLPEDELAPLLAEGAMWSEDRAVEEALQV